MRNLNYYLFTRNPVDKIKTLSEVLTYICTSLLLLFIGNTGVLEPTAAFSFTSPENL